MKKLIAIVTSLIVVLLVGASVFFSGNAVGKGQPSTPLVETKLVYCNPTAQGYCTVQHGLGVKPDTVLVTGLQWPGNTDTAVLISVIHNSMTSTSFKVRAMVNHSTPKPGGTVGFSYIVTGKAVSGTTTPTTTTTTTDPTFTEPTETTSVPPCITFTPPTITTDPTNTSTDESTTTTTTTSPNC